MIVFLIEGSGYDSREVRLQSVPGAVGYGEVIGIYEVGEVPCDGMTWKGKKEEPRERANSFLATVVRSVIVGHDPRVPATEEKATE